MKILHLECGGHVYGGGAQVAELLNGMPPGDNTHVLLCDAKSGLARRIRAPKAQTYSISMRGEFDPRFIIQLIRILTAERPDILHIHSRRGEFVGAVAGKLFRAKLILSRRVDNRIQIIDALFKRKIYSKIIAISRAIESVLKGAGIPSSLLTCIHDGISTTPPLRSQSATDFRAQYGVPDEAAIVISAAQFIPRKGQAVLCDAWAKMPHSTPQAHLLLFGQGPLESALRHQVDASPQSESIHFCGFREDLSSVLCHADIFVHPASAEGFGVAILEAARASLPIVASDAGGISEFIRHDFNGLLVPPNDADSLAAALECLLQNREKRKKIGQNAEQLLRQSFSAEIMVKKHEELYRSMRVNAMISDDDPAAKK